MIPWLISLGVISLIGAAVMGYRYRRGGALLRSLRDEQKANARDADRRRREALAKANQTLEEAETDAAKRIEDRASRGGLADYFNRNR